MDFQSADLGDDSIVGIGVGRQRHKGGTGRQDEFVRTQHVITLR